MPEYEYDDIDYRRAHADINRTSVGGDPNYASSYFGRLAHPFEVVFVKGNRSIFSEAYLERLGYSALCKFDNRVRRTDGEIIEDYIESLKAALTRRDIVPLKADRSTST